MGRRLDSAACRAHSGDGGELALDHRVQDVGGFPQIDGGIARAGTFGFDGSTWYIKRTARKRFGYFRVDPGNIVQQRAVGSPIRGKGERGDQTSLSYGGGNPASARRRR